MTLDEIAARADRATEGPWFVEGEHDEVWEPRTIYNVFHNGDTMDRDKIADSHGPDADFIQAAREDVPRLLAALRAVENLHRRYGLYELEDSCPNTDDEHRQERHHECNNEPSELYCEDMPVGAKCDQCSDEYGDDIAWPCPTITAIRDALG